MNLFASLCQFLVLELSGKTCLKGSDRFHQSLQSSHRTHRKETDRLKRFTYDEIFALDKANLDIFWPKDESLEDTGNLPPPAEFVANNTESLEAVLEELRGVEEACIGGEEVDA